MNPFRRSIALVCAAAIWLFGVGCSEPSGPIYTPLGDTNVEVFDAPLVDDVVVVRLPFENSGNEALELTKISTSCSCTAAAWENKIVQPGAREELVVFIRPGVEDKFVQSVAIETNGEESVHYTIRGSAKRLANWYPERLNFRFETPEPKSAEVVFDSPYIDALQIEVSEAADFLSFELQPPDGTKRILVVSVEPQELSWSETALHGRLRLEEESFSTTFTIPIEIQNAIR